MEDIVAKLGLKLSYLFTGLVGGSIALIFGGKLITWEDKLKAIMYVLAGSVVTGFITPLIFMYKPEWESVEYSVAFLVGIFGMGIIKDAFTVMYDFGKNPIGYIKILRGGRVKR